MLVGLEGSGNITLRHNINLILFYTSRAGNRIIEKIILEILILAQSQNVWKGREIYIRWEQFLRRCRLGQL